MIADIGRIAAAGAVLAIGLIAPIAAQALAFTGAVGFGANATGGNSGTSYVVTNLNDSGTGSFRDAVSQSNRNITFSVAGAINLSSAVSVKSNITIDGQSAPGDGIAIQGREVSFSSSSNCIVRYIRFRQGTDDPDSGKSALSADNASNMIFDHVSVEFGQWDNMDINSSTDITFQYCIIADPIGQQFNAHCDSDDITWYRNIWSSAHNRSPLNKGNAQYINNILYNFQAGYTAGNSAGVFPHDIVNNYFITGPSTTSAGDAVYQVNGQKIYFSGNLEDSNKDGTLNGSTMGQPGGSVTLTAPWASSTASLSSMSAAQAYAEDISYCGDLPRDQVDSQVIGDVMSLGKSGHLWSSQTQDGLDNNGYGTLDTSLIPNGSYQILSVNSGLALDVTGGSTTRGADLVQSAPSSAAEQTWTVTNLGNNVITLTNANSAMNADDTANSITAGTLIDQWTANNATNQEWTVTATGGGSFTLTCVKSGLLMDVVGASKAAGAQIDQWTANGHANQQWQFVSR